MKLTKLFNEFFESEKASGLILIFVTVLSLVFANSVWQTSYINFWQFDLGGHNLIHWINDGLMTIFFLLIGLGLGEMENGGSDRPKNCVYIRIHSIVMAAG